MREQQRKSGADVQAQRQQQPTPQASTVSIPQEQANALGSDQHGKHPAQAGAPTTNPGTSAEGLNSGGLSSPVARGQTPSRASDSTADHQGSVQARQSAVVRTIAEPGVQQSPQRQPEGLRPALAQGVPRELLDAGLIRTASRAVAARYRHEGAQGASPDVSAKSEGKSSSKGDEDDLAEAAPQLGRTRGAAEAGLGDSGGRQGSRRPSKRARVDTEAVKVPPIRSSSADKPSSAPKTWLPSPQLLMHGYQAYCTFIRAGWPGELMCKSAMEAGARVLGEAWSTQGGSASSGLDSDSSGQITSESQG